MKQHQGSFSFRPSTLALAIAGALIGTNSQAADEDIFFSELPVVASVTRLPQPLSEAPGAVTVIDRDMIRASGARNFADLLRLVPGFQVTPPNQDGAIVSYHGLSNEEFTPRVQVLIDGRSQYSPLFKSGVNWNLLPVVLENIDRIEVMRGSNTVSYGSNAYLGVVNIITLDASQTQGWMVSANHGNASIRDETIRWGGKAANADIRMTYRQLSDDGFRKMFDGGLGWFDPHDSRHNSLFDVRVDMPISDRDELRFSLSHVEEVSQFGRPKSTSDPFRDQSQNSSALSAEWRRALGEGDEVKLRLSHAQDWSSGAYSLQAPDKKFYTYNPPGGKSVTNELEFQHNLALSKEARLAWGLNGKYSSVTSMEQFSTTDWKDRYTYRVFGNLEYRPAKDWLLNFGGSLEYDKIVEWMFDPRISVSYHLLKDHTVRFIASRAHRSPSPYEAYGDTRRVVSGAKGTFDRTFFADPNLEPERIDTLEVGYLGEIKAARASLDVRGFREKSPNRIQTVPYALPASSPDSGDRYVSLTPGNNYPYGRADTPLNLEDVSIQGYEYQLRWQPFDTTRLMYGHAYIRTYANLTDETVIADAANNISKISRQTTESAPRNSQTAMIMQRLPFNIEASVMYYKSGWMRWRRNSYTSPYERVDWRLAWPFKIGSSKAEIAYVAQMSNHDMQGRRETRIANEMHWFTMRVDF
jgi:iron complex outermembrane receptor protein